MKKIMFVVACLILAACDKKPSDGAASGSGSASTTVKTETAKPAAPAETPTAPTLPTPPPSDGKWLVGGEQFGPEVLAPKLAMPTYFKSKLGTKMADASFDMPPGYGYLGQDTVEGYAVSVKQDPKAELVAKWGEPTQGPLSGDDVMSNTIQNDCWSAPEVRACLVQNGDRRDRWSIEFTMPKDAAGSATP